MFILNPSRLCLPGSYYLFSIAETQKWPACVMEERLIEEIYQVFSVHGCCARYYRSPHKHSYSMCYLVLWWAQHSEGYNHNMLAKIIVVFMNCRLQVMSFQRKMYRENVVPTRWDDADRSHLENGLKPKHLQQLPEGLWLAGLADNACTPSPACE